MLYKLSNYLSKCFAKHNLVTRYDQTASTWHKSLQEKNYICAYELTIQEAITKFHTLNKGQHLSVLDAGTGTGGFSIALCNVMHAKISFDLLDPSKEMLRIAKKKIATKHQSSTQILADINHLKSSKKSYDIILCAHVIEHCADPLNALGTLRSVLREDGIIILAVSKPHWCTILLQFIWRHQSYKPNTFTTMLRNVGFKNVHITKFKKGPPRFTSSGYTACH